MRKNLCSTENCKPSRIVGTLCCLAFLIAIAQYLIYEVDLTNNDVNNDHSKIMKKQPYFTGGHGEDQEVEINTQEIIDDALKHIMRTEVQNEDKNNVDGITHTKISDIEPDNHYANLGDDLDSSRHFDVDAQTAMGEEELRRDREKIRNGDRM